MMRKRNGSQLLKCGRHRVFNFAPRIDEDRASRSAEMLRICLGGLNSAGGRPWVPQSSISATQSQVISSQNGHLINIVLVISQLPDRPLEFFNRSNWFIWLLLNFLQNLLCQVDFKVGHISLVRELYI